METFEFRRIRELGDVLNGTFAFTRQNWKQLGKSIFIYAAPFALLGGAFGGLAQSGISALSYSLENDAMDILPAFGFNISLLVVFLIAASVMMAAVTYQYIRLYMLKGGNDISSQELWDAMKPSIAGYSGYLLASYSLIFLGIILCVVPGVYLLTPLSLILAVKTNENLPLGQAISRCFYLVKDYWWQTFLTLFVINIIISVAGGLASLPFTIVSTAINISGMQSGENVGLLPKTLMIASSVISYGISSLLSAIAMIAVSIQYFSLVERKEGAGSIERLSQIGAIQPNLNEDDFKETY